MSNLSKTKRAENLRAETTALIVQWRVPATETAATAIHRESLPIHAERSENCSMVKITLKINGMACSMCETHINDQIRQNFSVKKVSSSHKNGETVILAEDELDEEKLKAVIEKTGYDLLDVSVEPYQKKDGFLSFLKF